MADRGPVKRQHERFYIEAFIDWHNRMYRSQFKLVAAPDPPDGIIQSKWHTTWVEIADVFWSDAWARDLTSYATPGEDHVPIHHGPHQGMDRQTAFRFVGVLKKKMSLQSYQRVFNRHGPGYLVLPMMSPFFGRDTVNLMRHQWAVAQPVKNNGYFRSALIAFRSMGGIGFQRWQI